MEISKTKTELCHYFQETGNCRFGVRCAFAHGAEELRTPVRHNKYKTVLCHNYHSKGFCNYGHRCQFQHDDENESAPSEHSPQETKEKDESLSTEENSVWTNNPFDVSKGLGDLPTFKNFLL